jgi:uncharacterized protein (TIGR02453 family)
MGGLETGPKNPSPFLNYLDNLLFSLVKIKVFFNKGLKILNNKKLIAMETIISFLQDLKDNNNRDWFHENKSRYEEAKSEFETIVAGVIKGISNFDSDIGLLKPKDCVFRIYRDVRFSKNKDPYKINMGAAFSKGGRKSKHAGYYLHIEPDNSFIGGGKWQPEPDILKSIRYEIFNSPEDFKKIIFNKDFVNLFGELSGDKLKRPPKGFPPDFEEIELVKFKSYIAGTSIPANKITRLKFTPFVVDAFRQMKPFIGFLNKCVDHA